VFVRRHWKGTELPHHAQIISHRTVFDGFAVPEAHEKHVGLLKGTTGWRNEATSSKPLRSWGVQAGEELSTKPPRRSSNVCQFECPNYVKASMMWPRRDALEKTKMGATHGHSTCDGVPFGHQLLNREVQIGEGRAQHRDDLPRRVGAPIVHVRWHLVIEEVRGDQLVYESKIALVEDLLKGTAIECLVLFLGFAASRNKKSE
jgi:hypothetical protein